MEPVVPGSTALAVVARRLPLGRTVQSARAQHRFRPHEARIGPGLRAKLVSLVVTAALAPATLVGVASYLTAHRIQTEEVADRLAERAASAELLVSRFLEARRLADGAVGGSRTLTDGLEAWERARLAADSAAAMRVRGRLERYLAEIQGHDGLYAGLTVIDRRGEMAASTPPSALWAPADSKAARPAAGEGPILAAGPVALVHLVRTVHASDGRPLGTLRTASTLEPLWRGLAAPEEVSSRLRIVNGRLQTLFDSGSRAPGRAVALPAAIADRLQDLRVGNAAYAGEDGVEVVAAHRFTPALDFGALIELPAATAGATSRRLLDSTLRGSLATVGLLAVLGSFLALHLTRPLRSLGRGIRQAGAGDLSHRIPVTATDEVGEAAVAVNQMLDQLDRSSRAPGQLADADEPRVGKSSCIL